MPQEEELNALTGLLTGRAAMPIAARGYPPVSGADPKCERLESSLRLRGV